MGFLGISPRAAMGFLGISPRAAMGFLGMSPSPAALPRAAVGFFAIDDRPDALLVRPLTLPCIFFAHTPATFPAFLENSAYSTSHDLDTAVSARYAPISAAKPSSIPNTIVTTLSVSKLFVSFIAFFKKGLQVAPTSNRSITPVVGVAAHDL